MTLKKVLKIIGRILLILLMLLLIFTLVTFIRHRIKTKQEIALLTEKGYVNLVSVGDHCLNVAKFGNENGNHTIVALAGLGANDYSVAERKMTAAIKKENTVVFIDRAGSGLSDDTNHEMTLEFIVEDYRKALRSAGIEAPYILMPHSIGGAYANYWSSKYPDEIEAVVFVDGTQLCENVFDDEPESTVGFSDKALVFLAKLGFSRYALRQNYYLLPDNYSVEEQRLCDALELISCEKIANASESSLLAENGQKGWESIVTNDIPKLYICASWGYQTTEEFREYLEWMHALKVKNHRSTSDPAAVSDEKIQEQLDLLSQFREETLYPYAEKMGNCKVVLLGGDHAIYVQKPDECSAVICDFLAGV